MRQRQPARAHHDLHPRIGGGIRPANPAQVEPAGLRIASLLHAVPIRYPGDRRHGPSSHIRQQPKDWLVPGEESRERDTEEHEQG